MYTKLFHKMLDSSVWLEDAAVRVVWVTLLVSMDQDGFCQFASAANVAHRARVELEDAERAIACFEAPDTHSSNPAHAGRRIERVPGGWMVLNSEQHKSMVSRAVAREQTRERVAKFRAKNPAGVTEAYSGVTVTETRQEVDEEVQVDVPVKKKRETRLAARTRPPEDLRSLWNDGTTAPIPKCRELSPKRTVAIRARLSERPWSEWVEVVARIDASPFCRGQNDRGWVASFDWLIAEGNADKVLEGNYDNRASTVQTKGGRGNASRDAGQRAIQRMIDRGEIS